MKLKLLKEGTKTDTYLVRVYPSDEYYTECEWAILELNKELKAEVKNVKIVVDMLKDRVEDLYRITLWNNSPIFLPTSLHEKLGIENVESEIYEDEDMKPIKSLTKRQKNEVYDLVGNSDLRVDTGMMNIDESGVTFMSYIKNSGTSLDISTVDMEYFDLVSTNIND